MKKLIEKIILSDLFVKTVVYLGALLFIILFSLDFYMINFIPTNTVGFLLNDKIKIIIRYIYNDSLNYNFYSTNF